MPLSHSASLTVLFRASERSRLACAATCWVFALHIIHKCSEAFFGHICGTAASVARSYSINRPRFNFSKSPRRFRFANFRCASSNRTSAPRRAKRPSCGRAWCDGHPKTGLSSVLLGRCCLGSSGRDGESDRCDLGCAKTEIFCKWDWTAGISLIRFNKFGRARSFEIWSCTAHEATATDRGIRVTKFCATKRQMSGSARRFRRRFRPCRIRTRDLTSPPLL